jgi:Fe-S-cluster containining protein
MDRLYAIRTGELVTDNVRGEFRVTDKELIKIRERDTGGCVFYEPEKKACAIYSHRPSQCSAFACRDFRTFAEIYQTPRLTRWDLVQDGVLRGLMERHEERCGYALLEAGVKRIRPEGDAAIREILEILRFDHRLRPFVAEKLRIPPAELALLFGRPLVDTVRMFGLKVTREEDGSFLLTTLENG